MIYCCPRSGSNALVHALKNAELRVDLDEPFTLMNINDKQAKAHMHLDHIQQSRELFKTLDGFKILHRQTEVLREICEKNHAKLILLKRNDLYAQIASWICLMSRDKLSDSGSYETWTSSGLNTLYDPDVLDKRFGSFDVALHHFMRGNYLIDNILTDYPSYLTTVCYENPSDGLNVLKEYFNRDIDLKMGPNTPLKEYFVNHEEFEMDIKTRIEKLNVV